MLKTKTDLHAKKMSMRHINFGCGLCAPQEWLNFDSSPRLFIERLPVIDTALSALGVQLFPGNVNYGDIVSGLPLKDESADAVYASHVLEHLCRADVERALANTFRLLRSGGVFRLIVPDLAWRAEKYVSSRTLGDSTAAADTFIASCNIGVATRPQGLVGKLRAALGNSGHRWMYDLELMTTLLASAGFVEVRRCTMGDSGDSKFDSVEVSERFFDSGEPELAIQALKP